MILVAPRAPRSPPHSTLAAVARTEVGCPGPVRRRSLHLRAVRSVGFACRYGVARDWLFRRRPGRRPDLHRRRRSAGHVCPVGQFNFIVSTLSPLEVGVRDLGVCRSCKTVDCIKGRRDEQVPSVILQRGCELALFLPLKVGNLDCTFCLDCVQACPHDNVAIGFRAPGEELVEDGRRSSIRASVAPARSCGTGAGVHLRGAAQCVCDDRAGLRAQSSGSRLRCTRRPRLVVALLFVVGLWHPAAGSVRGCRVAHAWTGGRIPA